MKRGVIDTRVTNDPEFFLYEYTISSLILLYVYTFDRVTFEVNK